MSELSTLERHNNPHPYIIFWTTTRHWPMGWIDSGVKHTIFDRYTRD